MVQRDSSIGANFGAQASGSKEVAQASGGYVAPDASSLYTPGVNSNVALRVDSAVDAFLGPMKQLMQKGFDNSKELAYLEGAAQVGKIQAEGEIEGDMFTRDWRVAGYRDTMARWSLADTEAQLGTDMKTLREMTPEQFQTELSQRRNGVAAQLDGMSTEARKAMMGQLLTLERSAIKTQATEHIKFQVEQKQQAQQAVVNTSMGNLSRALASGSPGQYDAALQSAYSTGAAFWSTPEYNDTIRTRMTQQFAEFALSSDNIALYEKLRDQPIDVAGRDTPLLGRLSVDAQESLAAKYREAKQRNAGNMNTQYEDNLSRLEVAMEQNQFPMTEKELQSYLSQGMTLGVVDAKRRDRIMQTYYTQQYKGANDTLGATAFMANDKATLMGLGLTDEQGMAAAAKRMQKAGVTPADQIVQYIRAGNEAGQMLGFKAAGDIADASLAQLARPDGSMDPQHATVVQTLMGQLDVLDKQPNKVAYNSVLSGLSKENGMRLAKLRKLQADGFPTNIALSKVLESEAKESSMTPQMKVEQQRLNAGEDAKFLAGQTAVGTFGKLGLWVKSLWSNEAELSKAVQVPVSTARAQGEYMTRAKDAILEEFQDLDLVSPGISRDDRYRLATAQVQKRTVQTDQGPIVLPKNTSKAAYFGIPAASSDAYLSTALSNLLKSDEAGHHRVAYNVNGRLAWQEYDQDDVRGPMQYLDNTAVQKEVQRLTDADAAKAAKLHGPGFINRAHKVPVQYNGNNSAGAAASLMMKLRDTLVDHEGLNPYVTADSTGVLTGGVGITGDYLEKHVPGYKRGTTLTPEQINESFRDASNDAAVAGTRVAQAYNLGDPGFLLASELAYHAGTKFYNQPKYKEFLTALQQKNSKAAVSAFMDTKAYAVSGKARKASYLNLVQQIVR